MVAEPRAALVTCLWLALIFAGSPFASPRVFADAGEESYETQRLKVVLGAARLEIDPAPEGKTIHYIRYERRPVFEMDDLVIPFILPAGSSTWPNVFHWLTEQSMVQREVLVHTGEPFSTTLVDESMRNLRDLEIFSLVRIVAVKTKDPKRVGVVVYTRDLWSLRFEQDFSGVGSTFTIGAQVIERNFLGSNKALAVRGLLEPLRFSVGETYLDPRVLSGEVRLYESFDVFWNRSNGAVEGGVGSLVFGRPFYNWAQRTSYDLTASYSDQVVRRASGAHVLGFDTAEGNFGGSCALASETCLARAWNDRLLQLTAVGHYRIGERHKETFSLGAVLVAHAVASIPESHVTPGDEAVFRTYVLPKVRRDVYPYVRYRLAVPDYVVFTNLSTYGQSESVQIGPRLDGSFGVPLRVYGASSDGLVVHGLMGYVWAANDALLDVKGEGWSRLENGRVVDQHAILQLRAATPSFADVFGRFVFRALWDVRDHDTQKTFVSLGGDSGLRGYSTQAFTGFGASKLLCNVEYRTRPWIITSVHVGGVLFYDAGAVYQQLSLLDLHQAVGVGARVLFPQFNRYAFRVDLGVRPTKTGYTVMVSYGSDQVIPLTQAEDDLAATRLSLAP
jgi:hypothetical protein